MVNDAGKPVGARGSGLPIARSPGSDEAPRSARSRAGGAGQSRTIPIPRDLPAHIPRLEGKPSVIQQAAWKGAEVLAQRYYGQGGPSHGLDADSSKVISFIAAAMQSKPDRVLDPPTRTLLCAGFRSMGLPAAKVDVLVDSLAEAVAARLGYRPPISGRRMEDVKEAVELLRRGELEGLLVSVGRDREAAAQSIAGLIDRLIGRVVDEEDAGERERPDDSQSGEGSRDPDRDETEDDEERTTPISESDQASDFGAAEASLLPPNLGARLAELYAIAPEHTPVVYKAVLEFATTLAEMVGLEQRR